MSTIVFMTTMNTAASNTTAATTGRFPVKIAFRDSCPKPVSAEDTLGNDGAGEQLPDIDSELGGRRE